MATQTQVQPTGAVYPSLRGKRVIVSGGASGIGEGIVDGFVAQGARVAFIDIQAQAARAVADRHADAEHAPIYRIQDITRTEELMATLAGLVDEMGGCDILVNNAANDDRHSVAEVTPAYWDDRMAVNLKHQFFAAQTVAPTMKKAGGGVILNLGSISWHLGLEDLTLYQTAKAGVEGLTRSLARELGPDGIRVNTIIPGNIQTPRQMQWYEPESEAEIVAAQCIKARLQPVDVAALAMFLASDDARYCTAHAYWVDGGWR